jgi:hypothetical protein
MKEALSPTETPELKSATRRNIPEDTILQANEKLRQNSTQYTCAQGMWVRDICGTIHSHGDDTELYSNAMKFGRLLLPCQNNALPCSSTMPINS